MPAVIPGIYQGLLPAVLGSAAWYRAGVGQTDAGSGACSVWADQSGSGRDLLQGTGANRPTIQADGSLLFDGTAQFMKTGAFALSQPFTIYIVFNQISYTDGDTIYDARATSFVALYQQAPSPGVDMFAGATGPRITALNTGVRGIHTGVWNGASSVAQLNSGAEVTGNPGATALDGLSLGVRNDLAGHSNIQVWEFILRSGADDAATRLKFQQYLKNRYGI